jgi:hypothetical protein
LHRKPRQGIESTEWLIEEKYAWPTRQRAGQGHALRHATGNFARSKMSRTREFDQLKKVSDAVSIIASALAPRKPDLHIARD